MLAKVSHYLSRTCSLEKLNPPNVVEPEGAAPTVGWVVVVLVVDIVVVAVVAVAVGFVPWEVLLLLLLFWMQ